MTRIEDFQRVKIHIATQVIHNGVQKTLKKDYWVICSEEALENTDKEKGSGGKKDV